MAWKGIVGKGFTVDEFRAYVDELNFNVWRPSFLCLHNTAAPTLAQWKAFPAKQRILNLENYYKNQQKWNAGPHLFIADDLIWVFTPLTTSGVHSPSWNGSSIGVELVGDYSREDPTSGDGFRAYMNAVAAFAILHSKLGIDPTTIRLHKEDPRTSHDCPGKNLAGRKKEFIEKVREYMSQGGEHIPAIESGEQPVERKEDRPREGVVVVPLNDTLNVREGSSASSEIVARLENNQRVAVLGEVKNGDTTWYRIWARPTTDEVVGWVSAKFVKLDV
jgi:hypothetical protein